MKVDSYLLHAFGVVENQLAPQRGYTDASGRSRPVTLPMLLRVAPSWDPANVPELHVSSRLGSIVACRGTMRSIDVLVSDPLVISVEASRRTSGVDLARSLPFVKADAVHAPPIGERGDQALVAVIDEGIDVLHEAFRDAAGNTRILEIWDQTDPTGPGPKVNGLASYGTTHTATQINTYISTAAVPPLLGRDSGGHGTHVTSIAAGRSVGPFSGGLAPDAKIIVVIPNLQVDPTDPLSLGYSTSHQDALVYIKDFAIKAALPVVVNVSLGMNAGAHDGTSLLEAAFDEFSSGGREPGFIIVKSAGNERDKYVHARLAMINLQQASLEWLNRRPHRTLDHIELWWTACDELDFTLTNPSGTSTAPVNVANDTRTGTFPTGNTYEMTYERYHNDNGDSRLMVTIGPGRSTNIEVGTWRLVVQAGNVKVGDIHAWIERDPARELEFITHRSDEVTLSIPGTARTVIGAGSVASGSPFRLGVYSSYGPTRDGRHKPDLAAPGENISAAQATTANGVTSLSGTSMAAPHVTGAIALLLSHCEKVKGRGNNVNASQVRAAITQVTQNYNGRHNNGMGFGVLDVQALLKAFA